MSQGETQVVLPVGCHDFDDWLLDSLSVPKLLHQLQLKSRPRLDLINLCTPGGSLTPSLLRHKTLAATPGAVGYTSESSLPFTYSHGFDRGVHAAGDGGIIRESGPGTGMMTTPTPTARQLHQSLPTPAFHLSHSTFSSDMEEQSLREVAFLIFLRSCGHTAPPDLLASLRGQLEISNARAKDLAAVESIARDTGCVTLATPDAHVALLQVRVLYT